MAYAIYQSAKEIFRGYQQDKAEHSSGEHTVEAIAAEAGGWAGAIALGEAGAALGAFTGPAAPIAVPLLGWIGGAIGYLGGKTIVQDAISSGKASLDAALR